MGQDSIIFFALLVGFIIYVTAKGELPNYLGCIGFGSGQC
jgi:hypothetical protein